MHANAVVVADAIADTYGDGIPSQYYTDAACKQQVVIGTYTSGFTCSLATDVKFARGPDGEIWSVEGSTTCEALYQPAFDGQTWNCLKKLSRSFALNSWSVRR